MLRMICCLVFLTTLINAEWINVSNDGYHDIALPTCDSEMYLIQGRVCNNVNIHVITLLPRTSSSIIDGTNHGYVQWWNFTIPISDVESLRFDTGCQCSLAEYDNPFKFITVESTITCVDSGSEFPTLITNEGMDLSNGCVAMQESQQQIFDERDRRAFESAAIEAGLVAVIILFGACCFLGACCMDANSGNHGRTCLTVDEDCCKCGCLKRYPFVKRKKTQDVELATTDSPFGV